MIKYLWVREVRCEKCGNRIKEVFVYDVYKYICRKCLIYKEKDMGFFNSQGCGKYSLNYELTNEQKNASEFILNNIINKRDCLLNAVTGAGKTEIIYPLIKYCVDNKLNIGIVIPRKDVVIELYMRIKNDFKEARVVCVYGGNTKELLGDIIILTSHQAYRYKGYFDVIVIDEVDAFPFYKNESLNHFLIRSKKGNIVYMSATIPKELITKIPNVYYLNRRYHGYPLDVPMIKSFWGVNSIKRYIKNHLESVIIIYFPTIKLQLKFSKKLKIEHHVVNSKISNRQELLKRLHALTSGVILSTLVLERGITFKKTNVIVYLADHKLFNFENLVQISGRVGRSKDYPSGDIIFLVKNKSRNIKRVIKFIKKCNE